MSKPQQPNRAVQTSGSKSLDEKRREAVELMHAKGAMKANRPAGNGYYVCAVGGECHASCRIHKGKDDLWMMTWKEEHKLLCAALSQAPAHMLESTMSIIRSEAASKSAKEIQNLPGAMSKAGNAYGFSRVNKALHRERAHIPNAFTSLDGLKDVIGGLEGSADIAVGFDSWNDGSDALNGFMDDDIDGVAPLVYDSDGSSVASEDHAPTEAESEVEEIGTDAPPVPQQHDLDGEPENEAPEHEDVTQHRNSITVLMCKSAMLALLMSSIFMRCIDGTFKVAPRNSCLMILGYIGMNKVFYPVVYSLSHSKGKKSYESANHVARMFLLIEGLVHDLYGISGVTQWKDSAGPGWIRDGGKGYYKAIKWYFAGAPQHMCWFHLRQALYKKRKNFRKVYDEVMKALWSLHYCADETEFAAGLELLMVEMKKTPDGRKFVQYWNNTHFGYGRIDGKWAVSTGGEPTTNNALEGFNHRIHKMVLGNGSRGAKCSVLWCLTRYAAAILFVTKQQSIRIENHEERTLWTEWRCTEDARLLNIAGRLSCGIRSAMKDTFKTGGSHVMLAGGIPLSQENYMNRATTRLLSIAQWLSYQEVRHFSSESCTCPGFWRLCSCKHCLALRVIVPTDTTPQRIPTTQPDPAAPIKAENVNATLAKAALSKHEVPQNASSILSGVNLVFTGVDGSARVTLRATATMLGATVAKEWSVNESTHLLCGYGWTPKYYEALATPTSFILNVDWLDACVTAGERVSEAGFLIPREDRKRARAPLEDVTNDMTKV